MRCHTLAAQENLDNVYRASYFDVFVHEAAGRAVVAPFEFDVVVNVDSCFAALRKLVAYRGGAAS